MRSVDRRGPPRSADMEALYSYVAARSLATVDR